MGKHAASGSICTVQPPDRPPTIYEAAGICLRPNSARRGAEPPAGQPAAQPERLRPAHPRTQYFEISGSVGLYHGWLPAPLMGGCRRWSRSAAARAWNRMVAYDLSKDFHKGRRCGTQSGKAAGDAGDLAARGRRNNVFPLNHALAPGRLRRAGRHAQAFRLLGRGVSIPTNDQSDRAVVHGER
jgi:hypothetical protein